jgi:hypothetical protein
MLLHRNKEPSFVHGLIYTYNLVKENVMTKKSFPSFSVFKCCSKRFTRSCGIDQLRSNKNKILYYVCVSVFFVLVTRNANRIFYTPFMFLSVTCLIVPYFCTLSPQQHKFWNTLIEHEIRILFFSTTFVYNFSRSRRNAAIYHKFALGFLWSTRYFSHILI